LTPEIAARKELFEILNNVLERIMFGRKEIWVCDFFLDF